MGYKNVCLKCKRALNLGTYSDNFRESNCPECGEKMTFVSHHFRPPKRIDTIKWKVADFLISRGFKYHHIFDEEHSSYVPYPERIKEAKIFVEKYKDQAWK